MRLKSSHFNQSIKISGKKGFSLVELLAVVGIVVLLGSLSIPALTAINNASRLNNAIINIQGSLQVAKTYAVTNRTYVWVGFTVENTGTANPTIRMAMIHTKKGSLFGSTGTFDPSRWSPVQQPIAVSGVDMDSTLGGSSGDITEDDSTLTDTLTDPIPDFDWRVGDADYTFTDIIQFGPDGRASLELDVDDQSIPLRFVRIGLLDAKNTDNYAVIRVSGTTGNVELYRTGEL